MPTDPGGRADTLTDRITALRPSARETFSVALWRERGWTVEREGDAGHGGSDEHGADETWTTLTVESPDGSQRRRLFVPTAATELLGDGSHSDDVADTDGTATADTTDGPDVADTDGPDAADGLEPPPLGDGDRLIWPVDTTEGNDGPAGVLAGIASSQVIDAADLAERYRYALDSAAQARIAADVFDTDAETLLDRPDRTVESPGEDAPLAADARGRDRSRPREDASGPSEEPGQDRDRPVGTPPSHDAGGEKTAADPPAGDAAERDPARADDSSTDSVGGGAGAAGEVDGAGVAGGARPPSGVGDPGDDDGLSQSRVALAGTLALALLLVGAAAVGVGPLAPALADAVGEDDGFGKRTVWVWQFASQERGDSSGDTALDTGPDQVSTAVPSERDEQSVLPPGVASDGSLNPAVVASQTERILSNTSYRFVLTYRERVDGNTTASWREVATVENSTHFASEVSLLGTPTKTPGYIDRTPQYAEGDQYAEDGGTTIVENRRVSTEDPFLPRILQYVDWFLSVRESRLLGTDQRGEESVVLVGLRGDPWPGVVNTTGYAVISERGVVRAIHRTYHPPGHPEVTISVTVRVTDIGETTVDRPRWL
ncbi:MAG: hypothetical protein ABEI99_09115, partial [Halobaculum sp.]